MRAVAPHRRGLVGDKRTRILTAIVEVVGERGFHGASVGLVVARAGVSTGTFYDLFAGLEDCFTAVLDVELQRAGELIEQAFEGEESWCAGIRTALSSMLVFFDGEPLLARVWFVEAMAAGSWALRRRERDLALLREMIVEHWSIPGCDRPESQVLVGVMASVLGVIQTHLVTQAPEPLIVLLGPLMALVTAPYLDPRAVQREIWRAEQLSRALLAEGYPPPHRLAAARVEIPDMLRAPAAQRARSCVLFLARNSGVSNRQIAAAIGVAHQGQMSTLLTRLAGKGLLTKHLTAPGRPNQWRLTAEGQQIARLLESQQARETTHRRPAATAAECTTSYASHSPQSTKALFASHHPRRNPPFYWCETLDEYS